MAPTSLLKIKDWKEDNIIKVKITKPTQIGYFVINKNESECSVNFDSLLYFNYDIVNFDFKKFQSDFLKNHKNLTKYTEVPINKHEEPLEAYIKWVRNYLVSLPIKITYLKTLPPRFFFTCQSQICTTWNVLTSVMNTPFEINREKRKWTIVAKVIDNVIYLFPENNKISLTALAKHYEMLKKNLFTMNLHNDVISFRFKQNFEIYQRYIGNHSVIYMAETPAIISKNRINNFKDLKAAEHLFCDIFKTGEFSREIISYNPIWWAKAELINAKNGFIGMYNERNDCLQGLIKFTSDKFVDKLKFENLWSPDAAWNFLDLFLQFVKNEINSVRTEFMNKCLWQFKSFDNEIEGVTCEPLVQKTVSGKLIWNPVPDDWFH